MIGLISHGELFNSSNPCVGWLVEWAECELNFRDVMWELGRRHGWKVENAQTTDQADRGASVEEGFSRGGAHICW